MSLNPSPDAPWSCEADRPLTSSAEVEERRRPNTQPAGPGKRKADSPLDESDDGLQRAVKKLVRQAQLEADSPTNVISSGSGSNGNGNGAGGSSGTPGEPASRSSSRERPVFDAYPMPQHIPVVQQQQQQLQQAPPPQVNVHPPAPALAQNQNQNLMVPGNLSGDQQAQQGQLPFDFNFVPSPYTFPVDPSVNFPPLMPNQGAGLDPAIESMLASYFPTAGNGGASGQANNSNNPTNNNMAQPAAPQQMVGPEDFLSRVFSFGWNDASSADYGGVQGQQGQQGQNQQQQQQQQQQGNMGGGGMDMMGFGGDWGAGGGGWMA